LRFFLIVFKKIGIFIIFLIVCLVLSILSREFLTISNLINIARQASILIIVSTGLTLVMINGGIDLSIGSVAGLSGAILGYFMDTIKIDLGISLFVALLIALLIGILVGLLNGFVITKTGIAPFIITLAGLTIYRGVVYLITRGRPIHNISSTLTNIGRNYFFKLPIIVWIAIIFIVIFHIILSYTLDGIRIRQIGTNKEAAAFNGINVNKYTVLTYAISSLMASIGGILLFGRLNAAAPNAGNGYELDIIAAIVIGGGSLSGGVGTIWGTAIGVLITTIIRNGLNLLNINVFWQYIATGLIIVFAVIIDSYRKKIEEKI
jgi:ribose/xylose/arabinose/galactoside ABC-type transport system permease subunit